MAIDSPAKRSSALDHEEVWQWGAPLPDGTIGQGDRQHSIWSYSGILAGAAVVGLSGPFCSDAHAYHQPGSDAAAFHEPGSDAGAYC